MHFCLCHCRTACRRALPLRSRYSREGLRHQSHRKRLRHRQRPRAPRSFLSSENRAACAWNTRSAPARHAPRRRTHRPLKTMRPMLSSRSSIWAFLTLAAAVGIATLFVPRTPQPLSYHHFADRRSWLGIPNFGDVASNILFLVAGFWGLTFLFRQSNQERFIDARERWPYFLVFLGLLLTACGSAYYHLAPDNARLVWDRLPMTVVFMPLVAALIAERVSVSIGLWLLPVLTAVGIGSVLQWHFSEQQGAGDLRFYAAVQLYALLALLAALLLPPRYTQGSGLLVVAGLYVVAKVSETADHQIFSVGQLLSGHTLKHLAAGAAGFSILGMLQRRQPVEHH